MVQNALSFKIQNYYPYHGHFDIFAPTNFPEEPFKLKVLLLLDSVLTKRWAKWVLPALLISIVIYVAYGHSLVFDGKTLAPVKGNPWLDRGAAYWANAATAKLINLLLGQSELPLWADQIGVGVPLFSDPHNAFFSPFSFILYAFPSSSGWDVMTLIRLFILIFTSYLLFHRVLVSDKESKKVTAFILSLFAAIMFGFSGHVFYFLNLFHLNSLAFAPLFLLGAIETLENKLSKGLLFVTVSMVLMIFGGGLLDVILVTVLLFFIVVAYFFQHLNQLNQTSAQLSWLVVFGLLSLLLSAVFILPYMNCVLFLSSRSAGVLQLISTHTGTALACFFMSLP